MKWLVKEDQEQPSLGRTIPRRMASVRNRNTKGVLGRMPERRPERCKRLDLCRSCKGGFMNTGDT